MRTRISGMRRLFVETMRQHAPERDFSFLLPQKGMFSFSGLQPEQVDRLREDNSIYIVRSGRINVAAITPQNVEPLVSGRGHRPGVIEPVSTCRERRRPGPSGVRASLAGGTQSLARNVPARAGTSFGSKYSLPRTFAPFAGRNPTQTKVTVQAADDPLEKFLVGFESDGQNHLIIPRKQPINPGRGR